MAFRRSPAFISRVMRRRWIVAGAVGGIALGTAVGGFAVAASPGVAPRPLLRVLHAAPAFAVAGEALDLSAGTVCAHPNADACAVTGATASVRPSGSDSWTRVSGSDVDGTYRFRVPAGISTGGLDYRLTFRTADGGVTEYPPGGVPLHVDSTAQLAVTAAPRSFSWNDVAASARRALFLPYGDGKGEVGVDGGGPDQDLLGPSSFSVGGDGSISVVDWVNDRVEVFRKGALERTFATPAHRTFDVAVGTSGNTYLQTLGTEGATYEVDAGGRLVGRYPAAFGVASRVTTTSTGPAVSVAPEQWISVRSVPGITRTPALQAATATAAPVAADGSSARFGILSGGRVALSWRRGDAEGGMVLQLPDGTRAGTEYFAEPLADGGAVLALGLWNEDHNGVGLFRFDSVGALRSFSLLPEPSTRADARASTVRWANGRVLEAIDHENGMSIESYDLGGDR
ncbi:MAG TPA: hypothetical protein VGJ67_02360 [Actinomycetota bacterium]